MAERLLAAVLLVLALAAFVHFVRGGEVGFPPPRWPSGRARYFTRAASRIGLLFGAPSLALLAVMGRLDAFGQMPHAFAPLRQVTGAIPLGARSTALLGGAVLAGALIGAVAARVTRRRWQVGRIGAVLPRGREELGWGVLLSLVAGVCEEAFFRLLIPLLVTIVTGYVVIGFGVATLLFGAAHRYQGWAGMIATTVVGALLGYAYLATASLWVAMGLHVFIDLNALVLRPVVSGRVTLRG